MATKPHEDIYIGLDIGSTKVCCIVGLQEEGEPIPSIIGVGVAPTSGMRKGEVVDVDETVSSITAAIDEAERISGVIIDRATIGIDGAHVTSQNSTGVIAVGRADHEISVDDLVRVEEAATAIQLPLNREIVQVFPRSYTVDGQTNIKDPVGMSGVRLEAQTHIITGSTPALKALDRSLNQAGVLVQGRVLVPLAAGRAVLNKRQKELGVAIVDLGGGTTGVAVYEEGDVLSSSVLPVGANHITNDLAIGLRTDIDTAEKIKLAQARAWYPKGVPAETIKLDELGATAEPVTRQFLQEIVEARLEEIFGLVRAELAKVGKDQLLPGGVVLTGGGSKLEGIEELAKRLLKLPVRIGRPAGFSGIVDRINDPAFAAPVGLMLENMAFAPSVALGGANVRIGETVDRLKARFKKFLP